MTRGGIDDSVLRDRVHRYLHQRLPEAESAGFHPATLAQWTCGEPVPFDEAVRQPFEPTVSGTAWGAPWSTMWLRVTGDAPQAPPGFRVELVIDLGFTQGMPGFQSEGLAYRPDGRVIKAVNPSTRWIPVEPGSSYDVVIEAAANPTVLVQDEHGVAFAPTTLGDLATAGVEPRYVLGAIGIVVRHVETERLALELGLLAELAWTLDEGSARRARILSAVNDALDRLDTGDIRGTAGLARRALVPVLAARAATEHDVTAIGHAHIDSAWLWPFRETRRKVARTVANVLERMDADPDLVFAMSSAQQYVWLQEDHPELFERLRQRVAEGRFIPVGGMWVEADVVMPSGESLVRQLLHGSRYFEREFGVPTTLGWLPDSFGYSGALPQLLRSAGVRRFVTQKMSWNTVNRFPHHTFLWEGIDGSQVVTHFPSVDTYNSALTPGELAHAARNLIDPTFLDASIAPFGFGDGGGGPTREMLDRARLLADLEGAPRVTVASPGRFFDAVDEAVSAGSRLPVWLGEMYLEFHRGVNTSQARTKAAHRLAERLLREAELWSTQATIRRGLPYPYEELEHAWQELLLMEFHDVLPGSSIAWVHDEAEARLAGVATTLERLIATALDGLAEGGTMDVAANASPFAAAAIRGQSIGAPLEASGRVEVERTGETIRLRNALLEVTVDVVSGTVVSLLDRDADRELVSAGGRLHLPTLHRDVPVRWDAWDIDSSIDHVVEPLAVADHIALEEVAGSAAVVVTRTFGRSSMTQRIELAPGRSSLLLGTRVDWREREKMLKLEFPLAISTDGWAAETQFGYVDRPTHRNTSWDEARFEACAHRWVRVAEPGYGVAVVNERTYGHDVQRIGDGDGLTGTRVRASLLRSSRFPDPEADQGVHDFRFRVLPAPDVEDAVQAGYEFTTPLRRHIGQPIAPLVSSTQDGVVVEAIKLAEDRSGDVIVRLYEARGTRTVTALSFGFPVALVQENDILERSNGDPADLDLDHLVLRPFQVRTIRLTPG